MFNRAVIIAGMEAVIFGVPAMIGQDFLVENAAWVTAAGLVALVVGVFWDTILASLPSPFARWIPAEDAAQILYDRLSDKVEWIDSYVTGTHANAPNPVARTMDTMLAIGIEDGRLKARGQKNQKSVVEEIPQSVRAYGDSLSDPIDDAESYAGVVLVSNDTDAIWTNIQFKKSDLMTFVVEMEKETTP